MIEIFSGISMPQPASSADASSNGMCFFIGSDGRPCSLRRQKLPEVENESALSVQLPAGLEEEPKSQIHPLCINKTVFLRKGQEKELAERKRVSFL
ncbi:MAG: hypothetical protein K2H09_00145 [Treponemataceae bacterium]|nr:hypothetical protein [Treponemataceae bacterium]